MHGLSRDQRCGFGILVDATGRIARKRARELWGEVERPELVL